jgi:hypothetical protein
MFCWIYFVGFEVLACLLLQNDSFFLIKIVVLAVIESYFLYATHFTKAMCANL